VSPEPLLISLLLTDLQGGGAEIAMVETAGRLRELGYAVDIVVCERKGPLLEQIPAGVSVVQLEAAPVFLARAAVVRADPGGVAAYLRPLLLARPPPHRLPYLPSLARYLRRRQPAGLIAATPVPNMLASLARRLAGVSTRIALSQRNTLSVTLGSDRKWRKRYLRPALRRAYEMADVIIAVSAGVADDLAAAADLPRERIAVVYNPVVTPQVLAAAEQPLDHPWFGPGEPPVVLGVGRLVPQKDFPTLVRAFASLRGRRPARLMILGSGRNEAQTASERESLMALAAELGVASDVALPGFIANPYPYMKRAGVFVLSSRYEGLSNVLIQALACGCPVVSTDCPHGPAEIVEGGAYGRLVPVGDAQAMAAAIQVTLDEPPDRNRLRQRGAYFTVERAVDAYLALLRPGGP
jgi:glycosyltransferase involved in cell wall biosynthesis